MKALLVTADSRGDVEPFTALAVGLQERGHSPVVAAPARFAGLAGEYGIAFRGPDDSLLDLQDTLARGGALQAVLGASKACSAFQKFLIDVANLTEVRTDVVGLSPQNARRPNACRAARSARDRRATDSVVPTDRGGLRPDLYRSRSTVSQLSHLETRACHRRALGQDTASTAARELRPHHTTNRDERAHSRTGRSQCLESAPAGRSIRMGCRRRPAGILATPRARLVTLRSSGGLPRRRRPARIRLLQKHGSQASGRAWQSRHPRPAHRWPPRHRRYWVGCAHSDRQRRRSRPR